MLTRLRGALDPFILSLLAVVAIASVLPARGRFAVLADDVANAAIVLLFFLHGAKLSREAIIAGAGNWRLHLAVLATTFGVFPLLGLGIAAAIPAIPPVVAAGVLFLTLLPSTVQSSIAFTAIAGGNVAAAVCSASFSNLLGLVLTPLLVALLIGGTGAGGGVDLAAIEKIVAQLLLPFLAGHLLRPLIGAFVSRHRKLTVLVDRGSILLVVYTAFGAAVVNGLWRQLPLASLVLIVLLCCLLLGAVMALTWGWGKAFARKDAVVLLFCGSKKSLASGVPIARVLFPAAQVGALILPLMLFHQIQLIACAVIARALAGAGGARPVGGTGAGSGTGAA